MRLQLLQLCRHHTVLYGVCALLVKTRVHLRHVHRQADVTSIISLVLHTIQCHTLHLATTTEVAPACSFLPTFRCRSRKLFGLPFSRFRLVAYATSPLPFLRIHSFYRRSQGVVFAVLQRFLLRHVIGIAAALFLNGSTKFIIGYGSRRLLFCYRICVANYIFCKGGFSLSACFVLLVYQARQRSH